MEKIKNIEFLRVIGCMAIVLLHLFNKELWKFFTDVNFYTSLKSMTANGQKAVDLFFIISGFFFAYKLCTNVSIIDFAKRKLLRFYPVLLFVVIVSSVLACLGIVKPVNLYDTIMALLCLNGTGLILDRTGCYVGVFWYVSAMFWVMLIFYYLRKHFDKKSVDIVLALCVYFAYAFLIQARHGKIGAADQNFYYIFNVGLLRALGGIGIGYFIGEWFKEYKNKIHIYNINTIQFIGISVLEFACIFFIINNLMLRKLFYQSDFIYIAVFTILIILFLIKKGLFSQILDNNLWAKLSKYTYSIYMTHYFVIRVLKNNTWKNHLDWFTLHPYFTIASTLGLILIVGILTYHFVEEPAAKYLNNKIKKEKANGA